MYLYISVAFSSRCDLVSTVFYRVLYVAFSSKKEPKDLLHFEHKNDVTIIVKLSYICQTFVYCLLFIKRYLKAR